MRLKETIDYLCAWMREQVHAAGAAGVVLGISGGLDSAVAGAIAQAAFPRTCTGLIMPCASMAEDELHGKLLAQKIQLEFKVIDLTQIYENMALLLQTANISDHANKQLLEANIKARLRMITLYYYAQKHNRLVLGTCNKCEIAIGYFTKHGDGGADLQILGDLMKSEVLALAEYLEIPMEIRSKAPSGGLWPGQIDEKEMGLTYADLEKYLHGLPVFAPVQKKIETMANQSRHKRTMAPVAVIPEPLRG